MKAYLYLLIVTSTCCTLVAQMLLKRVLGTEQVKSALVEGAPQFVIAIVSVPISWLAVAIQALGFLMWLMVLSKEKMAIAFALSGSVFYLLVSFAGLFFFSERLSTHQWVGITLISIGVLLVAMRS